jgi:DNA polymerase zeta
LAEPLLGERVPYLVVYGMPGVPLYELVRSPHDLIENPDLKLNYEYYAMKQILPPLNRVFLLMNVNVFDWVKSISFKPKIFHYLNDVGANNPGTSKSIANYIYSTDCVLCGRKRDSIGARNPSKQGLCSKCDSLDQYSLVKLLQKLKKAEKRTETVMKICQLCMSSNMNLNSRSGCISLDCPNTYLCISAQQDLRKTDYIRKVVDRYF